MNSTSIKIQGRGAAVYLLKQDGEIVYVGQSKTAISRVGQHKDKKFDEVEIIWCSHKRAIQLERNLIVKHCPKHNKGFPASGLGFHPIRLSKSNSKEIETIVKSARNPLLTIPKAVNIAVEKGTPALKKMFVKK